MFFFHRPYAYSLIKLALQAMYVFISILNLINFHISQCVFCFFIFHRFKIYKNRCIHQINLTEENHIIFVYFQKKNDFRVEHYGNMDISAYFLVTEWEKYDPFYFMFNFRINVYEFR